MERHYCPCNGKLATAVMQRNFSSFNKVIQYLFHNSHCIYTKHQTVSLKNERNTAIFKKTENRTENEFLEKKRVFCTVFFQNRTKNRTEVIFEIHTPLIIQF